MRGNLALVPRLDGWLDERIDARARQLMQTLHLDADLLDRYPHQLSGGQRQRFGICRAMMLQPDLLLFDEPFSGVDPITRIRIHTELLALLRAEPATTLLVTHDVREAIRLSTYLVVMAHGRIVQHGSVDDVLASPADDDVARLFSEQLRDPATGVTR
jgi:osmoprotectant transport system ATP-binding protein